VRAEGERLRFEVVAGRRRAWRPEGGRRGRALDLFRDERRAVELAIRAAAPQVVHAHWTYEFALGALDSGVPHVITAHDSPAQIARYTRSPYRLLRWLMARDVLRRARNLTAVSDYMAAQVQAMARVPVRVVPNPVAPQAFLLGRVRAAPAAQRIGMVCNGWNALKNPEAALRTFALLRQRMPQAELHLHGSDFGPRQRAQRWAARHLDCEGLHWHGRLPHRELLESLAGLDLLLHPALEESFGMVVAEAMALGLPVVAGLRSGAVASVAGAEQWLVDVREPGAMARALFEALSTPARYAQASAAGRARIESQYTAASVAQQYLRAYAAALGGMSPAATHAKITE
jgi:glycosyltransferase involved in cell wall biosynthesis